MKSDMGNIYHLKWNDLTQNWVVIHEVNVGVQSKNTLLSKASVVSAMVIGLSSTAASAASTYQSRSAAERQNVNGHGTTVAYLDSGTSFDQAGFPLQAYRSQIQGLGVNTTVPVGSKNRLYFTDQVRSGNNSAHGTWMTYTILQQAPQANVVVGMLQGSEFNASLEDYFNAIVKISGEGKAKIIGTSTAWGNYNDDLVPFSYQKQYKAIKDNDALVIAAAGNSWPSTFAYAPLVEYTASATKDEALKYTGQQYGHWINVTGLNRSQTNIDTDVQHCQISMYYCVAAPQGPALRDAKGAFLRDEQGNIRYGNYDGTSWAAPNVTAIAGLVSDRYPWMSAKNIFEVVLGTADDIGAKGIDTQTGWGAVNREAALGGYGQFAWGQSELDIPAGQTAYFDNNIGDDRSVSGVAGGFNKIGQGVLVLNGNNTHRGDSNVQAGTVVVNGRNVNSSFNVYDNAVLVVGDAQAAVKNLNNAGRLSLAHLNSQLQVAGNYHGEAGSHLDVYAHLSEAEKVQLGSLSIQGNSSGETTVSVRQAGGANGLIANRKAQTDGYLLISVKGNSQAQFAQAGRITAGAYEYRLQRGRENANNWYLKTEVQATSKPVVKPIETVQATSKPVVKPIETVQATSKPVVKPIETVQATSKPVVKPIETVQATSKPVKTAPEAGKPVVDMVTPTISPALTEAVPTPTITNHNEEAAAPSPESQLATNMVVARPVYRPEAATVIGHQVSVHQLFDMHTLGSRRQFKQRNINNLGNQKDVWVAYRRDNERYDVGMGQVRLDATYDAVQTGVKVLGGEHFQMGVTAAAGQYDSRSRSQVTNYRSEGQSQAYAVGVYADYQQKSDSEAGLKLEGQILWNKFDHEVKGQDAHTVEYGAQGVSVQTKATYGFERVLENGARLSVQPQMMLDHYNIKADRVELQDGTVVQTNNKALWRMGAGVKVQADVPVGNHSRMQPYAEVNVYRQNRDLSVQMDQNQVTFDGQRQVVDAQMGVVAKVGHQTEVWAGAGMQWGDAGYRKANGQIGVRYHF